MPLNTGIAIAGVQHRRDFPKAAYPDPGEHKICFEQFIDLELFAEFS
jgi:hypothetical protein